MDRSGTEGVQEPAKAQKGEDAALCLSIKHRIILAAGVESADEQPAAIEQNVGGAEHENQLEAWTMPRPHRWRNSSTQCPSKQTKLSMIPDNVNTEEAKPDETFAVDVVMEENRMGKIKAAKSDKAEKEDSVPVIAVQQLPEVELTKY